MINLTNIIQQLNTAIDLLKSHAVQAFGLLAILWGAHLVNVMTKMRLNVLGIRPRRISGLIGIYISPLLHGNFSHLFFNSIPFFLLVDFMLTITAHSFWRVTLLIVTLSGLLVWLFARKGIHIGASSLVMGYWGFLLTLAFYQPTVFNLIVVVIMLYYLGSLVFNLLPAGAQVSVEGHIFGAIAGALTALVWIQTGYLT